jgi:hypothetical protein
MGERQLEGRRQRRRKSGQVRVVRRQCKSSCLLSWKEERALPRAADRAAGLSGISAGAEGLNIADTYVMCQTVHSLVGCSPRPDAA